MKPLGEVVGLAPFVILWLIAVMEFCFATFWWTYIFFGAYSAKARGVFTVTEAPDNCLHSTYMFCLFFFAAYWLPRFVVKVTEGD